MAEDKYKFSSEEELLKKLDSLKSEDEKSAYLKELSESLKKEEEKKEREVDLEPTKIIDELLYEGPSEAKIKEYESDIASLEARDTKLDSDTKSNIGVIAQALDRRIPQRSPLTAKRLHEFRMFPHVWEEYVSDQTVSFVTLSVNIGNATAPANWDTILNMEDVSLGAPFAGSYLQNWSGSMHFVFDTDDYTAGSIVTKEILVTWASGFSKTFYFEFLNKRGSSIMQLPLINPGSGSKAIRAYGCNSNSKWWLQHDLVNNWIQRAKVLNPISQFVKSEPIENPGGYFTSFELIAEDAICDTPNYTRHGYQPLFTGHCNQSIYDGLGAKRVSFDPTQSGSQQCKFTFKNIWAEGAWIEITKSNGAIAQFNTYSGVVATGSPWIDLSSNSNRYWGNNNATSLAWTDDLNYFYASGADFRAQEANNQSGYFYQAIIYADNLTSCGSTPGQNVYDVCLSQGAPNYYQTTGQDCSGNGIPVVELNGTVSATFNDGGCCVDCTAFNNAGVVITNNASLGTQDGFITWEVTDPTGSSNPAGTPWTSGSMYTIEVFSTPVLASTVSNHPPAGGNTVAVTVTTNITAGTKHLVTVSSNAQITPGMQISVPSNTEIPAGSYVGAITIGNVNQNVTQFSLVDNTGASVDALAVGTVSGTFATGFSGTFGYLLPNNAGGLGSSTNYIIIITDSAGCQFAALFVIGENSASLGCTDGTTPALNYNAAAGVDDGSCIICEVSTGNITDPSGAMSGDLFDSSTIGIVDATVNASNVPQSDGTFDLTANMQNTAAGYLETDGTQSYTMTLYDLSVASDPTSIISTVATQASLAVTTYIGSPQKQFTGLAYGHYAIKVQLVDSDEVHGLEPCYTYFFETIKVPVCGDTLADNYNTSSVPAAFQIVNNSLCTYTTVCCTIGTILEDVTVRGTDCSPFLYTDVSCDPAALTVTGYWELNGTQIASSAFALGVVSSTPQTVWLQDSGMSNLYTTNGTYTLVIIATYASQADCNITSAAVAFTLPICDCTDPAATINYNPLATIDDGSCIYPSWDCVLGNCTDPGTGNGAYNSTNGGYTACQASCMLITPGCTDSCASNYNALANVDDGSCTYKACLDPTASNQYWSCDCNSIKSSATIPYLACCTYPCATPNTVTSVTTNSSGSCTVPIDDGDVVITVTINTGAPTWTIEYYDNTNTSLIFTDTTPYSGNISANSYTTQAGTGLVAGNYWVRVTDSLSCLANYQFTIGTTSLTQGCDDPTAQNYDPSAQCDDGSCVYCGCMDLLANNYNPNAVCDDGSCDYTIADNPCIPPNIDNRILEITACLSEKGTEWLYKYKIGTADDCTIMNKWKLIFIQYLLKNKDLTCLYNCVDNDSPSVTTLTSCSSVASTGGPVTGLNDQGYAGSSVTTGGGTLITTPSSFFISSNTLFFGDVITMPSGLVWTKTSAGSCTYGCYNPETNQGSTSGNWTQCVPANNITITNSVNYLDNFINFANKYCRDCKIQIGKGGGKGK